MRRLAVSKVLVSAAAVVGLAAGTLATAGPGYAAPAQERAAVAETVTTRAVVNLGLSTAQAKNVQRWLAQYWGYDGAIDGLLGTDSWKAYQRCLKDGWGYYTGPIDGIVGSGTVKALQGQLRETSGYTGRIDGIAGPLTRAAFARFADAHA